MKMILEALLEISFYATLIAGAVLLFCSLMRKHISPKLQYLAWTLVLIRLCLPITLETGVHFEALFPEHETTAALPAASAAPLRSASTSSPGQQNVFGGYADMQGDQTAPPQREALPVLQQAETEQAAATPERNLYLVLFWVWLGGAIALAGWMILVKLRHLKRMRALRQATPPALQTLYAQCCAMCNIARPAPLWVVRATMSPGIALFGHPVVLFPEALLQDLPGARYALLHELTHLKRRDPWICLLTNFVRILYWFNPAVWFSFAALSASMEAACDADVLAALVPGEKQGYLSAVLRLFSLERLPQLGMAQFHTRRVALRRLQDAFLPRCTGKGARAAAVCLALMLFMCCFTTACQPTPEEPIVIAKDGDTLDELVRATSAPQPSILPQESPSAVLRARIEAPERWVLAPTQTASGKLTVAADAQILLPEVAQMPIAAAQQRQLTQDDIDRVMQVLFGDGLTWYDASMRTKEEFELMLLQEKQYLAELDPSDPDYELMKSKSESSIAMLEKMYAEAPFASDLAVMDTTLRSMEIGSLKYNCVDIKTRIGEDTFYFTASDIVNGYLNIKVGIGENYISSYSGAQTDAPFGVSMSAEEAAAQASAIVSQLTDELTLCFTAPAVTFSENTARFWGWGCVFMRNINGAQTLYTCEDVGSNIESELAAPVRYEKIILVLDDAGLLSFEWTSPMTVTAVENPDAALLPFSEIAARAMQQVPLFYAYLQEQDVIGAQVTFYRAELGLMRVARQDAESYYFLPVWHLYSEVTYSDAYYAQYGKPEDAKRVLVGEDGSYLGGMYDGYIQNYGSITLNALDGSVIDKHLGY